MALIALSQGIKPKKNKKQVDIIIRNTERVNLFESEGDKSKK